MANPYTDNSTPTDRGSQAVNYTPSTTTDSAITPSSRTTSTDTPPTPTTRTNNNIHPPSVSSSLFPPQNNIFLQAPSPNLRPLGAGGDSTEDLSLLNPLSSS